MPHFIHKSQIPVKVRRPHENLYRKQLRKALLNPALSDDQRSLIKAKLDKIERPHVATAEQSNMPISVKEYPRESSLVRLRKADLLKVGYQEEALVDKSMTKAQIATAILANRSAKGWARSMT